jgi:hypothetical protein
MCFKNPIFPSSAEENSRVEKYLAPYPIWTLPDFRSSYIPSDPALAEFFLKVGTEYRCDQLHVYTQRSPLDVTSSLCLYVQNNFFCGTATQRGS